MVEHDEAADGQAPDQRQPHQLRHAVGPLGQRRGVVVGDAPAHRHPRELIEQGQHRVEHLAAHVLEVQVDAVGAGRLQVGGEGVAAVADARVEAELVHDVVALLPRTGDAHHPVPLDLGNLPDHRAHRAGGGRHHDHVAVLQPADLEQADVGGQAGHAEHPEGGRDGGGPGVELADAAAVREAVLLPPRAGQHEVALGEPVVPRRHDPPHRPPGHHVAQLDRRRVRRPRVHAAPHVGVERQVDGADEHLARGGFRRRRLVQPEVGLGREPLGAGVQQNPAVRAGRHALHRSINAHRVANPPPGRAVPPAHSGRGRPGFRRERVPGQRPRGMLFGIAPWGFTA